MNRTSTFLNLILAFLVVAAAAAFFQPQEPAPVQAAPFSGTSSAAEPCDSSRSIQVSGAAVVYVTPDRALLQFGVQSNGETPEFTHHLNQEAIRKVMESVIALGIEAKDIATDYYLVYPIYQEYSSLAIKGYRIDNTVSVTVREVSLVEEVILAALRAGANEVQDVEFYTSQLRAHRDEARALAMQAAGEKAQALSSAAGAQAGCVLSISENTWTQYYGSWRGGRETALWAQNVIQNMGTSPNGMQDPGDSPISLGQIAIRAEVSASYSLK